MRVLSLIVLTLAISMGSIVVSGQVLTNDIKAVRPNFTGTWKMRPENPAQLKGDENLLFIVTQTPVSITVSFRSLEQKDEDKSFPGFTIYTDGRKMQFPNLLGLGGSTEIIGELRDGKFRIRRVDAPQNSEGSIEVELSADGNKLLCRTSGGPPEVLLERLEQLPEKLVDPPPVRSSKILLQDLKVTSRPN